MKTKNVEVKFANERDIPYLAVNGGHGAITTVGRLKNGIQIWMKNLSSVDIADGGSTAKIGGGTRSKHVTDALWKAGKQTGESLQCIIVVELLTGACECTSILGPGLGGGHGFLQGRYGLVSDQFVSANIVLANGSLVTIDETSDLWWALQGAGHNFGIVTSITSKVYEIQYREWAYESFIFTGDKVEQLYATINEHLLKSQPVDVVNYSFFLNYPLIDPAKPVIMFYILQEGTSSVDTSYTARFHDLGPLISNAAGGTYVDIPAWTGNSNEDPICQKLGFVSIRFPIDLGSYDIPAQREVYDLFASTTQATPALNNSVFVFEGYSLQGVKAVPSELTAYPFRDDDLLVSPIIIYAPDGPELDKKVAAFGESLRQILHKASGREELHTYVNYAFGDETKKNWYGYEEWRQQKLLDLKLKYDPEGKFSFYAPIA
ncbi:putative FAD-binding PCMH-type domain-containing protein [Seiridium cardinale]|uniref:FAD-binding PCMH-type domain-containing protein n=1 Tax=Seiridium cardinale TaxID=138064 RepID=A0ABR2XJW9_9PEZI